MNLFDFAKETPNTFLQKKIDVDPRLYLPLHLVPTEKKEIERGGKDICVPMNLPCYRNKQPCTAEGYTLISNGSKGTGRRTEKVSAYYTYTLRCQHFGRVARGSRSKKYKEGESAAPLLIDEKCRFSVTAYFESSTKRFFIRANGGRNFVHTGHSPVEREVSNAPLSNISRPTLDTVKKLLEANVPTNMINSLLEVMENQTLSAISLKHLRKLVLHKKHGIQPKESTGTTIIKLLEKNSGCEFVYMTGSFNQAMKKVRLHKRFRTKNASFAKDSRTNPVVSNDGDIIAPPPKVSTRKGKK